MAAKERREHKILTAKKNIMDPFKLTKFEAPLSGGPEMRVRRLMIAATLFASAMRQHGERYLRELAGILGKEVSDLDEELISEGEFGRLADVLGSKNNAIFAMRLADLLKEGIESLEGLEQWYGLTEAERQALRDIALPPAWKGATDEQIDAWFKIPASDAFKLKFTEEARSSTRQGFSNNTTTEQEEATAGASSNSRDAGGKTTADGQPTAGNAPDAGTSGGAAVDANVSSPTLAAGGGSPVGSGTASTPAAGSDATSTPGSAPGVASGPAAGAGPSSSDDGTKAATPAGKPKGKRGGGR
jgi:hypothetical protein